MFNSKDKLKEKAAIAAVEFIKNTDYLGVGTGSTVNFLIQALAKAKIKPKKIVASSKQTAQMLIKLGYEVSQLNQVGNLDIYVDGADEIDHHLQMIKGGGGALTGEKILASVSHKFICITDESKKVSRLGKFPLAIEVIALAQSCVARKLASQFGLVPELRNNFVSDYGNLILDSYGLDTVDAKKTESEINNIAGVVCNGIFAIRGADIALIANKNGIEELTK